MANDDIDLGSLDDLDVFDPMVEDAKDDRNPVSKVLTGAANGFIDQFTDSSQTVDTLSKTTSDIFKGIGVPKELSGIPDDLVKFGREAGEVAKQEGRKLYRVAENYIPDDGILGKLKASVKDMLGDERDDDGVSSGPSNRERALASTIGVLGEAISKSPLERLNETKNRLVNQSSNKILSGIQAELSVTRTGIHEMQMKYYRKSLELQYRTTYNIKSTLELQQTAFSGFRTQLESITKNTSLPDIQKINKTELFKSTTMNSLSQSLTDRLINRTSFVANMKNKFSQGVDNLSQSISGVTGGLDTIAGMSDMVSPMDLLTGEIANAGRSYLGGKVGRVLSGTKTGDKIATAMYDIQNDPTGFFGDRASKGNFLTSPLYNFLGSFLGGAGQTSMGNVNISGRDTPAVFTSEVKTSIIRVIPDLLSKILNEVQNLNPTNTNKGELYFSYEKNDFAYRKDADKEIKNLSNRNVKHNNLGKRVYDLVKKMEQDTGITLSPNSKGELISALARHAYDGGGLTPKSLASRGLYYDMSKSTTTEVKALFEAYTSEDIVNRSEYFSRATKGIASNIYDPKDVIERAIRDGNADTLIKSGLVTFDQGIYRINKDAHRDQIVNAMLSDIRYKGTAYKESTTDVNNISELSRTIFADKVDSFLGKFIPKPMKVLFSKMKSEASNLTKQEASKVQQFLKRKKNQTIKLVKDAHKKGFYTDKVASSISLGWSKIIDELGLSADSINFDKDKFISMLKSSQDSAKTAIDNLSKNIGNAIKGKLPTMDAVKDKASKTISTVVDSTFIDTSLKKSKKAFDKVKDSKTAIGKIHSLISNINKVKDELSKDMANGSLNIKSLHVYQSRVETYVKMINKTLSDSVSSGEIPNRVKATIKYMVSSVLSNVDNTISSVVKDVDGSDITVSIESLLTDKTNKMLRIRNISKHADKLAQAVINAGETKSKELKLLYKLMSKLDKGDKKRRKGSYLDKLEDDLPEGKKQGIISKAKQKIVKSGGLLSKVGDWFGNLGVMGKLGVGGVLMTLLSGVANAGEVGPDGTPISGTSFMERLKKLPSYERVFGKAGTITLIGKEIKASLFGEKYRDTSVGEAMTGGVVDMLKDNMTTVGTVLGLVVGKSLLNHKYGKGGIIGGLLTSLLSGMTSLSGKLVSFGSILFKANSVVSKFITQPFAKKALGIGAAGAMTAGAVATKSPKILAKLGKAGKYGAMAAAAGGAGYYLYDKMFDETTGEPIPQPDINEEDVIDKTAISAGAGAVGATVVTKKLMDKKIKKNAKNAKKLESIQKAMTTANNNAKSKVTTILKSKGLTRAAKLVKINTIRKKLIALLTLKATAKLSLKAIPLAGLGAGVAFGAMDFKDGHWLRGTANIISGIAGLLPGIGTGISGVISSGVMASEIKEFLDEFNSHVENELEANTGGEIQESIETSKKIFKSISNEQLSGIQPSSKYSGASMAMVLNDTNGRDVKLPANTTVTNKTIAQVSKTIHESASKGKEVIKVSINKASTGKISAITKIILDRIAIGEQPNVTVEEQYKMTFGNHTYDPYQVDITQLTISSLLKFQADMLAGPKIRKSKYKSSASGRYQFIRKTLKEYMEKHKVVNSTDTFSPYIQDKLAEAMLFKECDYQRWLDGKISNEKFIFNMSKKWASIENPVTGKSYYDQPVHTPAALFSGILRSLKNMPDKTRMINVVDNRTDLNEKGLNYGKLEQETSVANKLTAEDIKLAKSLLTQLREQGTITSGEYAKQTAKLNAVNNTTYRTVTPTASSNPILMADINTAKRMPKMGKFGMVGVKVKSISEIPKSTRLIKQVVVHCTATDNASSHGAKDINAMHKRRGWNGIGYHFLVRRDGSIEYGRNINAIGSHVEGHNTHTIGVAYEGGLIKKGGKLVNAVDEMTEQQSKSLINLTHYLAKLHNIPNIGIVGHSEFPNVNKTCPNLTMNDIRSAQYTMGNPPSKAEEADKDVEDEIENYNVEKKNAQTSTKDVIRKGLTAAAVVTATAMPIAADVNNNDLSSTVVRSNRQQIQVKAPDVTLGDTVVNISNDEIIDHLKTLNANFLKLLEVVGTNADVSKEVSKSKPVTANIAPGSTDQKVNVSVSRRSSAKVPK